MNAHTKTIDYYEAIAEDFRLILDREEARDFLCNEVPDVAALDFETTSLSPMVGEVRISSIYHPDFGCVILDHFFCGSFEELLPYYLKTEWVVYNAKFEITWFDHFDKNEDVLLTDVDFIAKSKLGGYPSSLARMCKRDLGVQLDKTLQVSDWSDRNLTRYQYVYAALDSVLTWSLYDYWMDEVTEEQLTASEVFQDVVRATIECEQTGLYLDREVHSRNVKNWERRQRIAYNAVRRIVSEDMVDNLNSNAQVSNFLKKQLDHASIAAWPKTDSGKDLSLKRETLRPIAARAPYPFSRFLNAFERYNYYTKYLSTYGETLLRKQVMAGKITSRFNIATAKTGRYSSSSSNLQNIPRKVYVREAFCCPPNSGLKMVLADYKGIEIRTLAQLTGDTQLLYDATYGDVHASSAATIFKMVEDEVLRILHDKNDAKYYTIKELRSLAKGFTFQILYGAGDEALSFVLHCSVKEAGDAVRAWAARYPKAYDYRNVIFSDLNKTGFIPVISGRTIYVRKQDRSLPVSANYGVQGAAGDVICRAMYHVRRLYRESGRYARLAATVHDELLAYAEDAFAEEARELMVEGMTLGWLDIFPGSNVDNLVDSAVGDNWAAKP